MAVLFAGMAAVTDFRERKIYNWTTYPGILMGFLTNTLWLGWEGLADSLVGFFSCGFVMLICFLLFHMGAGDVKLMAMTGAFFGLWDGWLVFLWTMVLGMVLAIAVLVWEIGFFILMRKTVWHCYLVLKTGRWITPTPAEREPLKAPLYLAPSAFIAVVIVIIDRYGRDVMTV